MFFLNGLDIHHFSYEKFSNDEKKVDKNFRSEKLGKVN